MRLTPEQFERVNAHIRQRIANPLEARSEPTVEIVNRSLSKYRNDRIEAQGLTFDSKREYEAFKAFELQRLSGAIRACVRQVSFQLPGTNRRIRIDFMVVENDGMIHWYDAKGFETQAWNLKRIQVKDAFGINIQLI
jgi:hypothetical protein